MRGYVSEEQDTELVAAEASRDSTTVSRRRELETEPSQERVAGGMSDQSGATCSSARIDLNPGCA